MCRHDSIPRKEAAASESLSRKRAKDLKSDRLTNNPDQPKETKMDTMQNEIMLAVATDDDIIDMGQELVGKGFHCIYREHTASHNPGDYLGGQGVVLAYRRGVFTVQFFDYTTGNASPWQQFQFDPAECDLHFYDLAEWQILSYEHWKQTGEPFLKPDITAITREIEQAKALCHKWDAEDEHNQPPREGRGKMKTTESPSESEQAAFYEAAHRKIEAAKRNGASRRELVALKKELLLSIPAGWPRPGTGPSRRAVRA